MKKEVTLIIIASFILIISGLGLLSAHLDAGEDKELNGYLIDFGYAPAVLIENEKTSFAINLVNASANETINPESVWVRISKDENIIFAGTFKPVDENIAFTSTFPKKGDYILDIKFLNATKTLVKTSFNLKVEKERENPFLTVLIIVIFIGLIALNHYLIKKRLKRFRQPIKET